MWVLYGSYRVGLTVNSAMSGSRVDDLGDGDDHELRRLERGEAHDDVHAAGVDLGLGVHRAVARDEEAVGLCARLRLLEGTLPEQAAHESADGEPQLSPQDGVVRLEDRELGAEVEARLDGVGDTADRHVLERVAAQIRTRERASSPHDQACAGEAAEHVDAE